MRLAAVLILEVCRVLLRKCSADHPSVPSTPLPHEPYSVRTSPGALWIVALSRAHIDPAVSKRIRQTLRCCYGRGAVRRSRARRRGNGIRPYVNRDRTAVSGQDVDRSVDHWTAALTTVAAVFAVAVAASVSASVAASAAVFTSAVIGDEGLLRPEAAEVCLWGWTGALTSRLNCAGRRLRRQGR